MGAFGNIMNATGAACSAFRESMLNNDPQRASLSARGPADWDLWQSRVGRYDLYWALYQNNAYRDLHAWATRFRAAFGMSKGIRHLYNPAARLGDFWSGHLMGGMLDREAGDGQAGQSALPILTDVESLRPAIARLWGDSNWQIEKEVFTRWGAVLGDVGLKVVDDTDKGLVRLEVVHPGHLKLVEFDPMGNVKGYLIERWAYDPRRPSIKDLNPSVDPMTGWRPVRYAEKAYREGEKVVYETYLNGSPYPWNGSEAKWDEPYGFIPLVVAHHKPVGTRWAENCFHSGLSRFIEVDGQASCVGDGNRRDLKAPHFIAGSKAQPHIKMPDGDQPDQGERRRGDDADPGRAEMGFLYGPAGSTATPLTVERNLAGLCQHIQGLLDDIEKNFPEMIADTGNLGGTVTAEAIRNARQRASSQVQTRRVGYDDALARAQKMAVAIGGMRGYRDYKGFGLDSFAAGKLDHAIGHRPVFEVDPLDAIEEDQAFWSAIQAQVTVGVPLALALERNGWSEQDLAALAKAKAAEPKPEATTPGDKTDEGGSDDEA